MITFMPPNELWVIKACFSATIIRSIGQLYFSDEVTQVIYDFGRAKERENTKTAA